MPIEYDQTANAGIEEKERLEKDQAEYQDSEAAKKQAEANREKQVVVRFEKIRDAAEKALHIKLGVDENGHLVPDQDFDPSPEQLLVLDEANKAMRELVLEVSYVPDSLVTVFG